jgi:hypothetical protein
MVTGAASEHGMADLRAQGDRGLVSALAFYSRRETTSPRSGPLRWLVYTHSQPGTDNGRSG